MSTVDVDPLQGSHGTMKIEKVESFLLSPPFLSENVDFLQAEGVREKKSHVFGFIRGKQPRFAS